MKEPMVPIIVMLLAFGGCASEPIYNVPADQTVADFVTVNQLQQVDSLRKNNRDSWRYLTDRYVIYRGTDEFLLEFRRSCAEIRDNRYIPTDYIHDHRNLRAGSDTIRGCIVERIYPITEAQRDELHSLGESPVPQY